MMVQNLQITSFLILPMLSFIILIFFGKKFKENSSTIALFLMGLMLLNALVLFVNSISYNSGNHYFLDNSFQWFSTGALDVNLGYYVDTITVIMLLVVALIGFLVHLYSTEYMKGDSRYSRYFAFLGIFIFSMNGIVLADSLIMMYIFWELVGLSSFLLIGFGLRKIDLL